MYNIKFKYNFQFDIKSNIGKKDILLNKNYTYIQNQLEFEEVITHRNNLIWFDFIINQINAHKVLTSIQLFPRICTVT